MLGAAFAVLTGVSGCVTVVTPPVCVMEPVTVYIADYGRHASLVMPSDAERGIVTEYAFGDWRFFALGKNSVISGVRALLVPTQATLGRRILEYDSGNAGELLNATSANRLESLHVDRADVDSLLATLDARYEGRRGTEVHNPINRLSFVKDDAPYGLLGNSNHAVADWLRDLGCEVRGPAIFSNFRVRKK